MNLPATTHRLVVIATISCALHTFGTKATQAQACYLRDGKITVIDAPTGNKTAQSEAVELQSSQPLSSVWGTLADGRVVATLQHSAEHDADALEGHSDDVAGPLCAVSRDGSVETLLTSDVLRAFVAPAGNAIAAITPGRDLIIWRANALLPVSAPGRVSHAAWSPDGARIAAAVYPPDFSPHAMDNAQNVAEFLRLQNSDIYLFDAASGSQLTQLTESKGTDYSPFFSVDGTQLYYTWLHETEKQGGLMLLSLDTDGGTSASAPAKQLTQAGVGDGKVPVGRVGTYVFTPTSSLVFEAGRPDGSGEIWAMKSDGKSATFVTDGRKPQRLRDGSISILPPAGNARKLSAQEIER